MKILFLFADGGHFDYIDGIDFIELRKELPVNDFRRII
jgi:hypothetical protein